MPNLAAAHSVKNNKNINIRPENTWEFFECLDQKAWDDLDQLILTIQNSGKLQTRYTGDSRNEKTYVDVLHLIKEIYDPIHQIKIYEPGFVKILMGILDRVDFLGFMRKKLKQPELYISRAQINIMHEKAFVGRHTDSEHDAKYFATCVFRTQSDYTGGVLNIFNHSGELTDEIKQPVHSSVYMDSSIEHEVDPVQSGYRNSLIVLLSLPQN